MGMDISKHQSRPVSPKLIAEFDLILTMEIAQKARLCNQYKELEDRIYLLSEMVGREEDIGDPIGGELFEYQETAFLLERILTDGFNRIYQLACLRE